jgi:hypothetical protein
MGGVRLEAVGLLTGWGEGVAALPLDARVAAGGRAVIPVVPPALDGERFRRATRECLLGVAAVHAVLREARREPEAIAGAETALIFVTAAGYGSSNVEFVGAGAARPVHGEGGRAQDRRGAAGTLRFPYTAPPALPAEVAIEFGLTGAYVILIGGAPATVDALWQAGRMVAEGRCQRALVLAVETFAECEALWRRARWTLPGPLVESAACALLVPGDAVPRYQAVGAAGGQERAVETRAGRTLACAPLVAAALAREAGGGTARLSGTWRGRTAAIELATTGGPCNPRKCSTS